MKSNYLLSNGYKTAGWFILIPSLILGIFIITIDLELGWLDSKVPAIITDKSLDQRAYFKIFETNITRTVTGMLCIVGALLVGFSREKIEDEYIARVRLSSLLWAVAVNYILLLFAFIFIYGTSFMDVMMYNMFTILLLFIARFNFMLHRTLKPITDEKQD